MPKGLGALERRVMEVIWAGPSLTVRQLCGRLEDGEERAYTTIMTTMDRLFRKGLLTREKDGKAWRYAAAVARVDYEQGLADQLARQIVGRHGELGLAAFVDAASADPALLDRLEAMIADRKRRP